MTRAITKKICMAKGVYIELVKIFLARRKQQTLRYNIKRN